MEGATLRIEFRDESPQQGAPGTTPVQSAPVSDTSVVDTQAAITQAGGVGNLVAKNQSQPIQPVPGTTFQVPSAAPLAVPPVPTTTASTDPLLSTVTKIVEKDPTATAIEIARLLQIQQSQAQNLLNEATGRNVPGPGTASTPDDEIQTLIRRERRLREEYLDEERRRREEQLTLTTPPAPPSSVAPPPIYIPRPPELSREQQIAEAERRAPPVQVDNNPLDPETIQGVRSAVGAISHFAHMAGPMGSAI